MYIIMKTFIWVDIFQFNLTDYKPIYTIITQLFKYVYVFMFYKLTIYEACYDINPFVR